MKERRVLVVDDSLTIRRLTERVLRSEGFLTDTAESIAEALRKVPVFLPDVVLLDYVLPDGYGTDACRALLSSPSTAGIPVVLISAKGGDIRQLYIDLPNVVDFITKPFTPPVLVSIVSHVLRSGEKRRVTTPVVERKGPTASPPEREGLPPGADVLLAGRTRLLPLDRVLDACQREAGLLRVELRQDDQRRPLLGVWLEAGRIVWAEVGRALLERLRPRIVPGADGAGTTDQTTARVPSGGLGALAALVRDGALEAERAGAIAREVTTEALVDCSDLGDLSFAVVLCSSLPSDAEPLQPGLSPDEIRMARLRRANAWHVIEEVLPSLEVVPVRTAESARQAARLGLVAEEASVLALVDGQRSVRELVALASGSTFEVCRVLYRLVEGGLVRVKQRRGEAEPGRIRKAFVVDSDPEHVYPGVVEALSEGETGIEVRCHREAPGRVPWAIRVFQPDALILDIRLDDFDAVKLVKLLRQSAEFHSMHIVATGECLTDEETRHLLRVGFSRILPKPFVPEQLLEAVLGERKETSPRAAEPGN